MTRWFRLYDDLVDDPKAQRLPPELFKAWINILCVASRNGGILPSVDDLAFTLRADAERVNEWIAELGKRGFFDMPPDGSLRPHNWASRQFKSDADPTAADRQARKRARDAASKAEPVTPATSQPVTQEPSRPVTRDITPSRTDTEADTDTLSPPSITAPRKEGGGGIDEIDCLERVIKSFPGVKRFGQEQALALIGKLSAPDRLALASGSEAYAAEYLAKPTTHPRNFKAFVTERLFANYAPRPISGPVVTILQDSPEGRALEAEWRATKGKPPPWTNGRWYVPAASATASEGLRQ